MVLIVEFKFDGFSNETARSMLAMMDVSFCKRSLLWYIGQGSQLFLNSLGDIIYTVQVILLTKTVRGEFRAVVWFHIGFVGCLKKQLSFCIFTSFYVYLNFQTGNTRWIIWLKTKFPGIYLYENIGEYESVRKGPNWWILESSEPYMDQKIAKLSVAVVKSCFYVSKWTIDCYWTECMPLSTRLMKFHDHNQRV